MLEQRFSTEHLAVAAIGGLIAGVAIAALSNRSARPILPAGAAVVPPPLTISTQPLSRFVEEVPGRIMPAALRTSIRLWSKPHTSASSLSMRTFPTLDALMDACPSQAEIEKIHADFNLYFGPDIDTSMSCTNGGQESSLMLSIYNILRVAYAMNFDSPVPLIGSSNVYEWLRRMNLKWVFEQAPEGTLTRAACSQDTPGNCVIDSVILSITPSTNVSRPESRRNPLLRYNGHSIGGSGVATGMNRLPLVVTDLSTWIHEARHTDAGGRMIHACTDHSGAPGSADSSLSYGGAYGIQYWFMIWVADHLPAGFLSPAQQHDARMQARSMRGPGGKFCDETVYPAVPLPSGRDLLSFWASRHSVPNAAQAWMSRDVNGRHLQASSIVLTDLPSVTTSELALSMADYVTAYGADHAVNAARQSMDDEATMVLIHPSVRSSVSPAMWRRE